MTHGSLFSGIGGFDLAAEEVGFENIWSCEINEYCRRVLNKNFPTVKQYDDIRTLINPESVDILSGGFPCQDISYAKSWTTNGSFSNNGINGKRSGLWFEYLRIINTVKPKWVVAENVSALTNQGLDIVLQSLSEIGYDAEWTIIPSNRFGAPHLRKRIWVVAYPQCIGRNEESIILGKVVSKEVRYTPQWEFSRTICKTYGKKALPESFGIYDGIPKGLYHAERLTSLGNSIVHQIAYEIFKAIEQYEHLIKNSNMEKLLKSNDGLITIDTQPIQELADASILEAEKINKFITLPITKARVADSAQIHTEAKVIRKTVEDQVDAVCRVLKDKKKDIDALQNEVKAVGEKILQPMTDALEKLKALLFEFNRKENLRYEREVVLARYDFKYPDDDLADLTEEDFHGILEYAKSSFVPSTEPAAAPIFTPVAPVAVKGTRKDWTFDIVNVQLIPRQYLVPSPGLLQDAVRSGLREIPGLKIYQKESIV